MGYQYWTMALKGLNIVGPHWTMGPKVDPKVDPKVWTQK